MNPHDDFEKDDMTFLERHRIIVSILAVAIISLGIFTIQRKFSNPASIQGKPPLVVSVRLAAPQPTPPPPQPSPLPQEIKPEEKMVMQEHVEDKEEKPTEKTPDAAPVTTGIVGNGSDVFGLSRSNGSGNYFGGSGGSRSQFGWYAAQVQTTVSDALRKNPGLHSADFNATVRIWSDTTGRVTRAKLMSANSDPGVDAAVNQSLTGLQLKDAPPAGMPMPIVMRIRAQRPN